VFIANAGYRWSHLTALDGAIVLAQGVDSDRLQRGNVAKSRVLFDPQLYLAGLSAEVASKACARLATYPWFGVELPDREANEGIQKYRQRVQGLVPTLWPGEAPNDDDAAFEGARSALLAQFEFGCTDLILPTPLVTDRDDEFAAQLTWLDQGIKAVDAEDLSHLPVLATLAVADEALNDAAFDATGYLDGIVDAVVSRGIEGVYLVVAQGQERHPFEISVRAARTYLHLAHAFSQAGLRQIVINFADVLGLLGLALGATAYCSGPSQSLRRLCLSSIRDQGFGQALPFVYSHKVACELSPESDLTAIRGKGLLGRVRDITEASQPLFRTVALGGSAADLAEWAESVGNVAASQNHLLLAYQREAERMREMDGVEAVEAIRDWLTSAAANVTYVEKKIGRPLGRQVPANRWLEVFDSVID
jgi:hypothetical protein